MHKVRCHAKFLGMHYKKSIKSSVQWLIPRPATLPYFQANEWYPWAEGRKKLSLHSRMWPFCFPESPLISIKIIMPLLARWAPSKMNNLHVNDWIHHCITHVLIIKKKLIPAVEYLTLGKVTISWPFWRNKTRKKNILGFGQRQKICSRLA